MTIEAACRRLADPPHPALGLAYYQAAELHRLTGAFDDADAEYRQANRHGYPPMPGLALLELARGDASGGGAQRFAAHSRRSATRSNDLHCWPRPSTSSARREISTASDCGRRTRRIGGPARRRQC